jgi:hypothetical protein
VRFRACLVVAALLVLAPRSALAGASARLVYVRGPGAETCPGEAAVRAAVSTRLGYDPFFAWAHETLYAEITQADGAYHAAIKLVGDDSRLRGARDLAVRSDDCSTVIDAMGLTISLTIDPTSLTGPRAAPPPDPAPASPPPPAPPAPPASPAAATPVAPVSEDRRAPSPPPDLQLHAYVGGGVLGVLGAEPSASAGGTLFVGAAWRFLSLDVEVRGDLPATVAGAGSTSRVQSYLLAVSIVPCAHLTPVFACPVLSAGRLDATSIGTTVPREDSDTWLGAGARAGVELPLGPQWTLRAYAEVLGTLRRDTLLIDGADAYTFPPASGGVGASVACRFR